MPRKYFNDAVIGNKNLRASFSKKGELIRLIYPDVDFRQFIDYLHFGVKINDSDLVYLHDDLNNQYKQYYTKDTNVLNTEIYNTYFKLDIKQKDFVSIKNNVLIKSYTFKNKNIIDFDMKFVVHSCLMSNHNNDVSGFYRNNALIQYMHDYILYFFSKEQIVDKQINGSIENIASGVIGGKDYIGMSKDSSIAYNINIKPGEEKTIDICIYLDENNYGNFTEIQNKIYKIKNINTDKEEEEVIKYWRKFLKTHDTLKLKSYEGEYFKKIDNIYKRTILLYPLLLNEKDGGIAAAIDIDENKTKSGRYAFCWTRDAVFITKAMDIINMNKETEKFYKQFCKNTQIDSGMWEQRYYTDGRLAPAWGYQIDETASVVHGIYDHYLNNGKNIKFLKDTLKMCENATKFLLKYTEDVFNNNKLQESYDLWEMFEGIHTYSLASIFSSYISMINIYKELKEEFDKNAVKRENVKEQIDILENEVRKIKKYILDNLYDSKEKRFLRNNKDTKVDISILGLIYPFNVFFPKEKKVLNTIEKMNLTIRTYRGGYLRFEKDDYVGENPWVISTLWMALYYIEKRDFKKAKECFDFAIISSTKHGFLGEQVDNETMEAIWVIGLGWSHAMFILVLEKFIEAGIL